MDGIMMCIWHQILPCVLGHSLLSVAHHSCASPSVPTEQDCHPAAPSMVRGWRGKAEAPDPSLITALPLHEQTAGGNEGNSEVTERLWNLEGRSPYSNTVHQTLPDPTVQITKYYCGNWWCCEIFLLVVKNLCYHPTVKALKASSAYKEAHIILLQTEDIIMHLIFYHNCSLQKWFKW